MELYLPLPLLPISSDKGRAAALPEGGGASATGAEKHSAGVPLQVRLGRGHTTSWLRWISSAWGEKPLPCPMDMSKWWAYFVQIADLASKSAPFCSPLSTLHS